MISYSSCVQFITRRTGLKPPMTGKRLGRDFMDDTIWTIAHTEQPQNGHAQVNEQIEDIDALVAGLRDLPCCGAANPIEAIRSRAHNLMGIPAVSAAASHVEDLCDNILETGHLEREELDQLASAVQDLRQATQAA